MSSSQKISVISLVYKKGEKNYLSNYRPIRLTNTDYKIIAFVFAKRLQKVDIKDFSNILENKSNWLCEYGIIKYTLQPFIKKYNLSNVRSTNIHDHHFRSTQNLAT